MSDHKLKPLPPDPFRHQDSAIAQLVALHEIARHNPQTKGAVARRANELVKRSDTFRDDLEKYNASRFSGLIWASGMGLSLCYGYELDGQTVLADSDGRVSDQMRVDHIERERAKLYGSILAPFYDEVQSKWQELSRHK